jgi:hypothetical protein
MIVNQTKGDETMKNKYWINHIGQYCMFQDNVNPGEKWVEITKEAFHALLNERNDKYEAIAMLKTISETFIHIDGDTKGNKVKTDIFKYCPNVRDVMNANRQLVWKLEKVSAE